MSMAVGGTWWGAMTRAVEGRRKREYRSAYAVSQSRVMEETVEGEAKTSRTQWGPGMGRPVMSAAACHRSFSQSASSSRRIAEMGPKFPRTSASTSTPSSLPKSVVVFLRVGGGGCGVGVGDGVGCDVGCGVWGGDEWVEVRGEVEVGGGWVEKEVGREIKSQTIREPTTHTPTNPIFDIGDVWDGANIL